MLLTKECDYAIRILRALSDGTPSNIQTISQAEQISVPMAYKLAHKLEQAGYLKSSRGPGGGYTLTADLKSATLYDVCLAVDKDLFVTECVSPGFSCSRNLPGSPCRVHQEFIRIQKIMRKELQWNSLYDILFGSSV
ncbi:MAG: Rrf2 family transcriptional regulator [Eubacteriales bacterium]|nr:Rrf2 family transcriptional regulator [Eubacteriales bacterium]